MPKSRVSITILLCAGAVSAQQEIQPVIDRPITLPRYAVDMTLQGSYVQSAKNTLLGAWQANYPAGETLAIGVDIGATDQVQFGLGMALAIHPGSAFGSVTASGGFALSRTSALRVDAGIERVGFNGDLTGMAFAGGLNAKGRRYFGGVGAHMKVPLVPGVAFVTGRSGAVQFGNFSNVGYAGTGLYAGASSFAATSADFLVVSAGNNFMPTNIGLNLPLGLLAQAGPSVALTMLTGYAAIISIPNTGDTQVWQAIPLGFEAVISPTAPLDIGFRFMLDGWLTNWSGGIHYADHRTMTLWLRWRV